MKVIFVDSRELNLDYTWWKGFEAWGSEYGYFTSWGLFSLDWCNTFYNSINLYIGPWEWIWIKDVKKDN